jgi:ABC-type multidrug transport system, ATPase and permease components
MEADKNKISLKESWKLNRRALAIWRKCNPKLIAATTASTIVSALTPYVSIYLSALIINELAGARDPARLTQLVIAALVSAAVLALLGAVLSRWRNCENCDFWYIVNKIYTDKLLSMDFRSVDAQSTHDLYSQIKQNQNWSGWGLWRSFDYYGSLLNAVTSVAGAVALSVGLFLQSVPESAGTLTVLNNPAFMALIIAAMLAVTFLSPVFSNKANSYWNRSSEDVKMGNRYFSFFGFMSYDRTRASDIRMYRQDKICKSYTFKCETFTPKSKIAGYARGPMGLYNAFSSVFSVLFTGIIYAFVCLKAWAGAFGVGSVTQYIGAITALSGGIAGLVRIIGDMRANAPYLRTVFEFFDIPNDMYQGSLTTEKRSDRKYDIEFRHVSFKYPGTENWALRDVSMRFNIGERLAVVGRNGSGKTTFIKLLCRLYDPDEGEILLNGIDIRKYDYAQYMDIFAVVFQDFKLLAYGLGQNVAAAALFDRFRAEECLREAGFGERLDKMTAGLDTCLYKDFDEKGVEISGGEAQKIALARALYKNAPFIILDEPTAALDPVAEYEIYTKFDELVGDKTAIYISHRLSSCRFCDDIAVFDGGTVVQHGTHEALLANEEGLYRELWYSQAQYYAEKSADKAVELLT